MAIYHCSVKICSRGNGQSAVSEAAYRSGTDLINEWSGIPARYSFRTCIAYSEIMLPATAPPSFSDRQTLWNSVEMNEKRGDAQLAREIEVALPKELSMEENIRLVREYCQQFINAGMCVDLNVHDKEDGNPHCHILMTMRALDANGHWLPKSHQEFVLDENGERIKLPNGRWKSRKVFTTDWDNRDKAEQWRVSWQEIVNRYLEKNQIEERIDHRSNAERGIEELPTIHMGPVACAMEKQGIQTDRGDTNRTIRAVNRAIKGISQKISSLKKWLADVVGTMKEFMEKDPSPSLTALFRQYLDQESQKVQKYSPLFQLKHNASEFANVTETLNKLGDMGIFTLDDLERELSAVTEKTESIRESVTGKDKRMKELNQLISHGKTYQEQDPIRKELNGIKWTKQKEKFEESHRAELTLWNAANRYLHAHGVTASSLPKQMKSWQEELRSLDQDYSSEYDELKNCRAKVKKLDKIHRQVVKAMSPEQSKDHKKQKQNIER